LRRDRFQEQAMNSRLVFRTITFAVPIAAVFALGAWAGPYLHQVSLPADLPPTAAVPLAGTAASSIPGVSAPNYRAIVAAYGPAVVNVNTEGVVPVSDAEDDPAQQDGNPFGNDPFFQFFRNLPAPRGRMPMHGLGSGFIVSRDGLILTNAHVVRDASLVTVKLSDRREFKAKVLGVDPATDIAVLKINAGNLPTVRLGDSDQLGVGDYVLAIGAPYGFEESATSGIVSAKGRTLPGGSPVPFIQTDVAVNPGNSGGPLFDTAGNVIGINSQIYSNTGGYEGLSFAIPIKVALQVKDQIVTTGKVQHARLGVMVQPLTQALARSFHLDHPDGALVSSVTPDGAAARAGIQPGDVILSVDGTAVRSVEQIRSIVSKQDQQVALLIARGDARIFVPVPLA
jgi:serine protease Do